ncbi:MAG TPA: FAD-dependent monooxygenase [Stellaceae bacterium]|jgi:2-polyprenyl-6-methoxyphenol hydroxylase-like FAD-dependent oxidoreductase|nr:FAD-dependent monooxygenase [Stellaceae bacterium]
MAKRYQVIIIGGGPVGVGLAVNLGLRGISVALVERRVGLSNIPKGQNLSPRTLEHFYFWGCVDQLRAERLMPRPYPISGITAYGSLMSDYWFAPPQREITRPYYFQDVERLPQYLSEKVLRGKMETLPNVETRFGWRALSIEQDEKGVRLAISEEGGSGGETLEGDYLVGCDGARSLTREQIGIDRGGADFEQLMVLAVFRSKELHEGLKRFPGRSTYNVLRPEYKGYWQFFGRIDVGEGWFFHSPVPAGTTTDNYDFHGLIQNVAGFPFKAEFDHVGFWDLRVAVAERYQVGRVFIAGDAAHSHPPYGGFGLNNGLEDVVNLGWKLEAQLKGWGSDKLLQSYSEERHPIFKETGEDFIAGRIEWDRQFLDRYSPERNREEFERAWAERKAGISDRLMTYEPNYEGSPVIAGPPGGKTTAHGDHSYESRAGHHLAPQMLSSGKNVFEELGQGFALLAFGASDADAAAFTEAARALNLPLKVIRDTQAGGREAYKAKLTLVRPDQYVVWCGNSAPADTRSLLAKAVGRS